MACLRLIEARAQYIRSSCFLQNFETVWLKSRHYYRWGGVLVHLRNSRFSVRCFIWYLWKQGLITFALVVPDLSNSVNVTPKLFCLVCWRFSFCRQKTLTNPKRKKYNCVSFLVKKQPEHDGFFFFKGACGFFFFRGGSVGFGR